jgi:hypothetical protein
MAFKMPTKNNFFFRVFWLFTFEGTFTKVLKDKKSKKSRKTVEIKVFRTLFAR